MPTPGLYMPKLDLLQPSPAEQDVMALRKEVAELRSYVEKFGQQLIRQGNILADLSAKVHGVDLVRDDDGDVIGIQERFDEADAWKRGRIESDDE